MVARLRTLTGCLSCRRRRKKCDEKKPICVACQRNRIACQWPTLERTDGRRRRCRQAVATERLVATKSPRPLTYGGSPPLIEPGVSQFRAVFDGRDSLLVDYCLVHFLPSQYHKTADGRPTVDLSYLRYMCLDSPCLLDAVAACATIDSTRPVNEQQEKLARRLYMTAISEISAGIANRSLTGTEDHLLATVIWLCVFERSCSAGREYSAIHAAALRKILLLREPMDSKHCSTAELIWERMCVESYIYHSAVTTLFDCRHDLLDDTLAVLEKFQSRMSPCPDTLDDPGDFISTASNVQSPVLGAPYHVFLALMQGIRLVRTKIPRSEESCMLAWSYYHNVAKTHSALDTICTYYEDPRRWIGRLYACAIRLLFLYYISSGEEDLFGKPELVTCYAEIRSTIDAARKLLIDTAGEVDRTWGKFFLWPLAVIGAVVCEEGDICLMRNWLDRVFKRGNSSDVVVIREVLERRIWAQSKSKSYTHPKSYYGSGLTVILNTSIMNETATSLASKCIDKPTLALVGVKSFK